jgi:hypothetical protein
VRFLPFRLKARKYQLGVAFKTPSASSTTCTSAEVSSTGSEVIAFNSSRSASLSSTPSVTVMQPLTCPEIVSDGVFEASFEADIFRVRSALCHADLKRKFDILNEVWAREFAALSFVGSSSAAAVEGGEDDEFDPHLSRARLRGGNSDCLHVVYNAEEDIVFDDEMEKLAEQCLEVAATFVGKTWTAEAIVRFKLNFTALCAKLNAYDAESVSSEDDLWKCEETSEMLYGDTQSVAAPEERHAELDQWIEELEKTADSQAAADTR